MAMLLAPYRHDMRIGQGFNSYTQEVCLDNAVVFDPDHQGGDHYAPMTNSPGQTAQITSYTARLVERPSDVLDAMRISGYSAVKGSFSSVSLFDTRKFRKSDIRYLIQLRCANQTKMRQDVLEFAGNILPDTPDSAALTGTYGDTFISGFLEGAELTALLSITLKDRKDSDEIKRMLQAAFGMLLPDPAAQAAVAELQAELSGRAETTVMVMRHGGDPFSAAGKQACSLSQLRLMLDQFAAEAARIPQRTHAILSRYTTLRSFRAQCEGIRPFDYGSTPLYTAALVDEFIEYQYAESTILGLLVRLQRDEIQLHKAGNRAELREFTTSEPYEATLFGLLKALGECRTQQSNIMQELDNMAANPVAASLARKTSALLPAAIFNLLLPTEIQRPHELGTSPQPLPSAQIELPRRPMTAPAPPLSSLSDCGCMQEALSGSPILLPATSGPPCTPQRGTKRKTPSPPPPPEPTRYPEPLPPHPRLYTDPRPLYLAAASSVQALEPTKAGPFLMSYFCGDKSDGPGPENFNMLAAPFGLSSEHRLRTLRFCWFDEPEQKDGVPVGSYIYGFQLEYADGRSFAQGGGTPQHALLQLEDREEIHRVEMWSAETRPWARNCVSRFKALTNRGRVLDAGNHKVKYVNEEALVFERPGEGWSLRGLYGQHGGAFDRIGLVWGH